MQHDILARLNFWYMCLSMLCLPTLPNLAAHTFIFACMSCMPSDIRYKHVLSWDAVVDICVHKRTSLKQLMTVSCMLC